MTNIVKFKELASAKLYAERARLTKKLEQMQEHESKISSGEDWKNKRKYLAYLLEKQRKTYDKVRAIDKQINAIITQPEEVA